MPMTIGELASKAGVNVPTVRYYERRRILSAPDRTTSGYRQYDGDALRRLRFIKKAQELGFSLDEIAELLDLRVDDCSDGRAVEAKTRATLERVRGKIRTLERMEIVLAGIAKSCATGACPVLDVV